jgi:drug/metabolite transporter (DMT)-like permease
MLTHIDGIGVAAALLSAFLHAAWNAAVKASPTPQGAMAAQVIGSGLVSVPLLLFVAPPGLAALPWLCGSAIFNVLVLVALLRGYAAGGGFGFVYPLARAVSPLLVLALAHTLQGEAVGPLGVGGIALVSGGVSLFAFGEGRQRPAAFAWALFAGVTSAAYVFCDANGARHAPSVLGYGLTMSIVNAVVFATFHRWRSGASPLRALRAHPVMATVASAAAMVSYLLILWVWSRAPIAIGAALRDTSVVFAALIAIGIGERLTRQRLAAIVLVTTGACLIRLA